MRNEYSFLKDADDLVKDLDKKFKSWSGYLQSTELSGVLERCYNTYYGLTNSGGNYRIGITGEQGEFSTINNNHSRNLIKHIISLVTQNRLNFDSTANNADVESRNTVIVANAVLDKYFFEKRADLKLNQTLEQGLIFGTSFLYIGWKPGTRLVDVDGDGQPIYAGEPEFKTFTPFDVIILEPHKHDWDDQNAVVTRELVNRFDIAAEHPELEDKILAVKKPDFSSNSLRTWYPNSDEASVWVYKAYHRPTPALPQGRYTVYLDGGLVLEDKANPYDAIPLHCYRPDIRYNSAYGHTPLFDLLAAQEALDFLDGSMMTIMDNFAIPNVVASKRFNADVTELSGGMRLIQGDPDENAPNGGFPTPMQMPAISGDMERLRQSFVNDMEKLSGISSILRGAPQQSIISGTAAAIFSNNAVTFNSSIENGYVALAEFAGMSLLSVLRRFQREPEMLAIVGSAGKYQVTSFLGADLEIVNRVKVSIGNPMSKSLAGRMAIAEQLLNQQMLKSPAEYMEIMQTGTLRPIIEAATSQLGYVKLENEQLTRGEKPMVFALDNHSDHVSSHKELMFYPDVRNNAAVLGLVLEHIQEHLDLIGSLSVTNPAMFDLAMGLPMRLPQPASETGVGGGEEGAPQTQGGGQSGPSPAELLGEAEASQSAAAVSAGGNDVAAKSGMARAERLQASVAKGQEPV